jgi:hypothetical protein
MTDEIFIELFHGRTSAGETMEDWGEPGPVIGPFRYAHITYASVIHICVGDEDFDLDFVDDCVRYDGMLYGDFSVIGATLAYHNELRGRREDISVTLDKLRAADLAYPHVAAHVSPVLTATNEDLAHHLRILNGLEAGKPLADDEIHPLEGLGHFVSEMLRIFREGKTHVVVQRLADGAGTEAKRRPE